MHTVGSVLVKDWHDHRNISAIIWAGLPGQESGNSLTDVLYGSLISWKRTLMDQNADNPATLAIGILSRRTG